MTKEEAIEDLEVALATDNYIFTKSRETLRMAISALKGGWIPIEEGYPEELKADDGYVYPSDYVLTFNAHGMYHTSRYWGNRTSKAERPNDYLDWVDLPSFYQDVIAWQPLPDPYKKGE